MAIELERIVSSGPLEWRIYFTNDVEVVTSATDGSQPCQFREVHFWYQLFHQWHRAFSHLLVSIDRDAVTKGGE